MSKDSANFKLESTKKIPLYTIFNALLLTGAARSIESLDRVPLSEKCVHHIRYVILLFSFHHVKINFTT